MKRIKQVLLAFCISAFTFSVSAQGLDSVCKGRFFNPVSDTNWNYSLPFVIFGKAWGGSNSDNPPEMLSSPICNCPSFLLYGANVPGIFFSYWRPYKVIDVSRVPGCSVSLGGKVLLEGYEENFGREGATDHLSTRSVQEWDYDVLGVLKIFEALGCNKVSSISLGYDSNIDPTMNGLPTGATGESEAVLFFANLPLLVACFADTVATLAWHPLTFLPHCHGSQTPAFPFTNILNHQPASPENNYKQVVVHLQRQAARFQEWVTIGPTAKCFSHPFYFLMKGGYRINKVYPFRHTGSRKYKVGSPIIALDGLPTQTPLESDATFLLWKAHQCCLKTVP